MVKPVENVIEEGEDDEDEEEEDKEDEESKESDESVIVEELQSKHNIKDILGYMKRRSTIKLIGLEKEINE